jgi:hypothetical protein
MNVVKVTSGRGLSRSAFRVVDFCICQRALPRFLSALGQSSPKPPEAVA